MDDTSGLSDDEVRDIAGEADKAESKAIIKKRADEEKSRLPSMIEEEKEAAWEELSPTPRKYDWIELISGEWLKGDFKAMYEKELEFDSDKLDLQVFDFDDIKQIRTHRVVTVSLMVEDDSYDGLLGLRHTTIAMMGILRLNGKKVSIIRGDGRVELERKHLISIAYGGENEYEYWSGKFNVGLDIRRGNSEKLDYTAIANLQRRSSKTRLQLDYLGNMFTTSNQETANNHRINESFNVFVTKKFYYTPLFAEYLRDKYQNIRDQYTVGVGIGYTIVDTKKVDWDISGGPAMIYVKYDTVEEGRDDSSRTAALELSTSYDVEVTKKIDFVFDYKLTLIKGDVGDYKHHMVTSLENEITKWLDVDIAFIWDYTQNPEPNADMSVPVKSDMQLLVSLGVDF